MKYLLRLYPSPKDFPRMVVSCSNLIFNLTSFFSPSTKRSSFYNLYPFFPSVVVFFLSFSSLVILFDLSSYFRLLCCSNSGAGMEQNDKFVY